MKDLKPTGKLNFYLARMASRGFGAEQVLAGTGLRAESLDDSQSRPHPLQYRKIILNMIELTRDPFLGITLGAEFKISDLGILGYAALSASTLKESRELYDRYRGLNEHIFASTNYIKHGRWFSEIQDVYRLGDVMRFAVEEFVSQTIELAATMTNKPFPILELHVTYPQPPDVSPYIRRFNCPIYFNQARNIVVFDINRLQDPISLANEEVFKLCARHCEMLASKRNSDAQLSDLIRNYLVNNPGEFPTLEEMAGHLNIGSRTLRRRLVSEDLSYQKILDDTRKDLAIQYLQHTALTPKEIGYLLGYSSVSNFRRAFKGWTNHTLSDVRLGAHEPGAPATSLHARL
ncbi:AraC family transcriptional regulator [Aromatoleum anaerobium]|uniref:Helix-turn-helix domain-containing protein n=1 Tax=Aromatoleum anaerobium TaxID=182180 RepID=A0ABX1PKL9_9RHOO|nr:AraC family transcriptional regulator [Aromatoleum anaerobium]MCK0508185.1 AraC family transcriptional regulator [Aromatoleum anaerobium]